jgi:hypothetical protein
MPDSLTAPVHSMLARGMSVEDVVCELRRLGLDQHHCALALHRAMTIALDEAEKRVAKVWGA